MASTTVEWVPASAAELTDRRRRVRTADDLETGFDTITMGVGVIAMPLLVVFGAPTPLPVRLTGGLVFGLMFYLAFMFSRRGIYLTRSGVTIWRGILPRQLIPWSEVDEFRLTRRRVDLGRNERERVCVVTRSGTVIDFWYLNRDMDFESRQGLESAKAKLRSFPTLIDQLNGIACEAKDV